MRGPHAPRLTGKRVLITGASSGVGRAAARMFGAEGARLALVARNREALEAVVAEHGLDAIVVPCDLGAREEAERAVREAVLHLGGLDIVVSNAGVAVFGHVLEVHPEDFDRTMDVTFRGAVDVVREALPHLRESRGMVVATGSLMARLPLPTWSAYAASKHALRGFLASLRVEELEQGSGVEVCMVHPGPIDTPLFSQASTASGVRPRVPPDAYRPEVVGQALVEAAVARRSGEVVLGGETKLVDLLYLYARPVAERVLVLVDRWYSSGDVRVHERGSLWDVPPHGTASGEIPARDSLYAPVQLGSRMLPEAVTPLRFAAHMAHSARIALRVRRQLLRRRSERPRPERPLSEVR